MWVRVTWVARSVQLNLFRQDDVVEVASPSYGLGYDPQIGEVRVIEPNEKVWVMQQHVVFKVFIEHEEKLLFRACSHFDRKIKSEVLSIF